MLDINNLFMNLFSLCIRNFFLEYFVKIFWFMGAKIIQNPSDHLGIYISSVHLYGQKIDPSDRRVIIFHTHNPMPRQGFKSDKKFCNAQTDVL